MKYQSLVWIACAVAFFGTLTSNAVLAVAPEVVKLGSPELTAGIPSGADKLSVIEIKAFLENPKNHVPLEVVLPMGLDLGKDAIYIPEDNLLTRAKIELGRQLYFDTRLSVDNSISCASCHHPDSGYGFNSQFGIGVNGQTGNRNSPVSFNRILSKAQFWDGRAGSLEDQAVGPMANAIEMGGSHTAVVTLVESNPGYKIQFDKIFGRKSNIEDVGRAIAAFERVLVTGPSPYDYFEPVRKIEEAFAEEIQDLNELKSDDPELYAKYTKAKALADANPMSDAAKRGRTLFFSVKANCSACHVGANFTDELYHNLGVGMEADKPDLGRYDVTKDEKDRGAFKTPTIRNIVQHGPYMHDGTQNTLEEVVEWYDKGGHPNPKLSNKIQKLNLSAQDKADLVAFMKALTGPLPVVAMSKLPE